MVLKILLIVVGALVALVLLLVIVGACTPRDHVASRTARFSRPPAAVFALITPTEGTPAWRGDVNRVEILGEVDGRLRYREYGRHGAMTYEVMEQTAPTRLVGRIVDENLGYGGTWTWELAPAPGGGTDVTVTERGFVTNLMFRGIMAMTSQHGTMDRFLVALGRALGEEVTPRDAGGGS